MFHWTSKLLSTASRVILLKHVLRAIPTYFMMAMALNNSRYKDMENFCSRFLWGNNKHTGKNKKALIAWSTVAAAKINGGLGFSTFHQQANTLKMRHISKVLTGEKSERTLMVDSCIRRNLRQGPHKKERKHWTTVEALLLCPDMKISCPPLSGTL